MKHNKSIEYRVGLTHLHPSTNNIQIPCVFKGLSVAILANKFPCIYSLFVLETFEFVGGIVTVKNYLAESGVHGEIERDKKAIR